MPNQSNSSDIIVVKGTAPLEDLSQIKKFKKKPVLRKYKLNQVYLIKFEVHLTQRLFPDKG